MTKTTRVNTQKTQPKRRNIVFFSGRKESFKTVNAQDNQIEYLQNTIGNQAVQRLFKSGKIQTKLRIGKPDDKYEKEADKTADRVMKMPEAQSPRQSEPPFLANRIVNISETSFISKRNSGGRHRSRRCTPTFYSLIAKKTGKTMAHKGRGWCELEFGVSPPGITFESNVYLPASCKGGRLEYLQLLNGYRQILDNRGRRKKDKTRGYELDTKDPYYRSVPVPSGGKYTFKTNDSPGHPIGKIKYIKIDETYKMWILWRPRRSSRRKPLGVVKWQWGVTAKKIRRSGCRRAWKLSNLKEKGGTGYRTNRMPSWRRTASLPNTHIP